MFLFALTATCAAQLPSETDVTRTPVPNAGHDYIRDLSETVNPANGSLSIRIGVPIPPSRGFSLPFNFAYDSDGVFYLGCGGGTACANSVAWDTSKSILSQGGWSYSGPMLSVQNTAFSSSDDNGNPVSCNALTDFVMQTPTGDRRNLGLTYFSTKEYCNLANEEGPVTTSQEGSLLAQTTPSPTWNDDGVAAVTVTDGDGTAYYFPSQEFPPSPGACTGTCVPSTYSPTSVTDRNGNVSFITSTRAAGGPVLSYTDTIGRPALNIPTLGANPDSVTVSGLPAPYQVNWTTVEAQFSIALTHFGVTDTCAGPGSQPAISAISAIVLPNGQQYTFSYIPTSGPTYGLITKITYPSGGYVRYVWGLNPQAEYGAWPTIEANGSHSTCAYIYDTPAVTNRYVSFDGVNEVLEQDFSYCTNWETSTSPCPSATNSSTIYWAQKATTVTTIDKVRNTQFKTVYTYGSALADYQPNAGVQAQIPVEAQVQYYDTNGTLLKTVNKLWGNERIMTQQTTTLSPNLVTQSDWAYNSNEMPTEKDDYDYDISSTAQPGQLIRKTITGYQSFAQNASPVHIVDKPASITVENSAGTQLAGVTYSYCQTLTMGSCPPPGNLLSRSDWVTAGGGSTVTTSHSYDAYGNITSTMDPDNNITTYTYGPNPFVDSCQFTSPAAAYLSNITYPAVNGVPHQENFQYYCASGNLANTSDENNQVTTYKYNTPPANCATPDGLSRLSEIDYPDTGKKTFCYFDGTYIAGGTVPNVTTSVLMAAPNTWKTTRSIMDGMGHEVWSEITSDPQGASYVNTVYDGEDNVWKVSNPSYSQSGLAYTTYAYDALKRKVLQTNTDNTYLQWSYNGLADQGQTNGSSNRGTEPTTVWPSQNNWVPVSLSAYPWVDVSDENGNHSQQISDGLGFLAAVLEPNASDIPALETDYQYDILGNLTQVDQWGGSYNSAGDRRRSFSYDSLSRLQSAMNPESGTTSYSYLANGVLCSGDPSLPCGKTDARGASTNYAYDALNRLTGKSFSGGSCTNPASPSCYQTTPSSCFQYDVSSVSGNGGSAGYLIGRLTNEWTQSSSVACGASPPSSGYRTLRSILDYDRMGRITSEQECAPSGCATGSPYAIAYGYDLAGDLTYSTNGISTTPGAPAQVAFTSAYDGAGRLQALQTSWNNNSAHPGCLFAAQTASLPATPECSQIITTPYAAFGGLVTAGYGNGLLTVSRTYDNRLRINGETDTGSLAATPGTATVTITGAEQSH